MSDDEALQEDPGDLRLIKAIDDHCEKFFGPVDTVLHEIRSPLVHIDVFQFNATGPDSYHVFVTCGMSSRPMNVSADVPGRRDKRFAELVLCLPPDWPVGEDELRRPENFWPIGRLKSIARLPHLTESWLGTGHTIGDEDPSETLTEGTDLSASVILSNVMFPPGFGSMSYRFRKISFYQVALIHGEERRFIVDHGFAEFYRRLAESGMSPRDFVILNPSRTCVV